MTLETELERIKQDFLKQGPGVGRWESYGPDQPGYVKGTLDGVSTRLRLDFAVAEPTDFEERIETLFVLAKAELEDLLEEGDVNHVSDALLKAMDGAAKRGCSPDEVKVVGATLMPYPKNEYAFFCVLNVKWPS